LIESDYIARIAVLETENAELRLQVSRIPLLELENKALREQVLLLSQKLSDLANRVEQMSVRKDSNNSSMPPSGDFRRKTRSLRTASGLKPGGQPGHKGTTLEMTPNPDFVAPLVPLFCGICAKSLDTEKAKLVERRQMIDIPPIQAQTTEFLSYGIPCNCGHFQVAPFPEGVDKHIQYGPNISALTVYHNVYQYIPYKRLQDFFTHICHLPISIGTLENIVGRMADKARPIWDGLRKPLEQSRAVGGDETGAKVNGKKQWIWVWQSTLITFIAISASRGSVLIDALFPNGFPLATLSSDRWKAQIKTFAKNHQLCIAHLLRELLYLIQAEKTSWANEFKELLLKAIKLKQAQPSYDRGHPQTLETENQLDSLLAQIIPAQNAKKTISLQKSMTKYRQYIFPFLYDPLIPYDNNASERSIRNVKVKLKVSGQFKTGQEHYCILRSIIDTTIKNGQSVFAAIAAIAYMPTPPKAAV
jgi:transposase